MEVVGITTRLLAEAAEIGERLKAHARAPAEASDLPAVLDHHRLLLDAVSRLAAAVAWLLWCRAVETGELARLPTDALPPLPDPPAPLALRLPPELAGALGEAAAFHRRIARLAAAAQAVGASG